jgi:hypothetical protein
MVMDFPLPAAVIDFFMEDSEDELLDIATRRPL